MALVIRDAQMRVFEDDELRRWVEQYLKTCYPDRCSVSSSTAFSVFVRNAIRKARSHSLSASPEIRKYVHVAFLLGPEFENMPEFSWARDIMTAPEYNDEGARLRALEDAVMEHLKADSVRPSTA